jgi:hypothetical protein
MTSIESMAFETTSMGSQQILLSICEFWKACEGFVVER